MAELPENRHSMPSFGYSFFVDNESGYAFNATLSFEALWFNSAPGYNIEVLDPEGRLIHKEFLECVDYKDPTVFHGPSYGKPDASPPVPVKYPEHEAIFPRGASESVQFSVDVPASEVGGIYQIRIVTVYASINSEGRMSTVELILDPPLPYGWKGDMGFTDLCKKDDRQAKSGSVYFCSLPPQIIDHTDPNAGLKQWFQARDMFSGSAGFNVKIFKDVVGGDDVLIKEFNIEETLTQTGERRRSWAVHETSDTPSLTLDYSISGPEHLRNESFRQVYRIDWVNLDDGDGSSTDHANALMVETHEITEVEDREPDDFKPPTNYLRHGATDVPLILCSDRNTAIRLNNGISYEYDEDLEVYPWDSQRITFLNANQRSAWQYIKQARQDYKLLVVDEGLVNTSDDPYWVGRPGIDLEGDSWDYAGAMQASIRQNLNDDFATALVSIDPVIVDFEITKYWGEDKVNRLSNAVVKPGLFEFLPCHIFEQNMDPTSPWFGVFWNWHKNLHQDIKLDGADLDALGNPNSLGNPYASVFRYLHDAEGNIYSNWKDQAFPRLGPTSGLGAPLARMYSLGDTREDLGLGFLRDANPFYKNAGIRNRLVLALLHQLMQFDQNGDSPYWNDDYRGGALAFTTNTIVPLLDVWEDIGSTEDDIFTGEDAEEVKQIIKIGVMNHLERYAGYLLCSAHNQWVHAWIALAKAAACFNDSAIDFLFLRNIKVSDNRYNHNVPVWQESGGYCNIYCLFAIYSLTEVRGYLLKRRDKIIENGEGDDVLAINELTLRDYESQINDLTDYWNHTIVIEPDGSVAGSNDYNSRVDGSCWATSPRRFLEFIGNSYGDTIDIPVMEACHSLVAWTTGRNYENWNDMYRQWQHNITDPYGVSFNFDEDNGDDVSFVGKRDYIKNKLNPSLDNPYSPTRFRENFDLKSDGQFKGLGNRGVNPSYDINTPRKATSDWMDKEDDTLDKTQGPKYANFGISPNSIPNELPSPLPAHINGSFVKLWPSFVVYNENQIVVRTNQKNTAGNETSATRQDLGGVSVKTDKYYCHIHTDGWNPSNQDADWNNRINNGHDPEYMWALGPSAGGGFSLLTTPENGSVLCGRRKGWMGSNQIYMKRYKQEDDVNNPNLGQVWNDAIDEDGCGYAWAEPSSDSATAEWTEGTDPDHIGTLVHKQHFNRNFLAKPTDLQYSNSQNVPSTFDGVSELGGIGYLERTYKFNEDNIECTVVIVPKRTVTWDDIYMTLPINIIGRGYNSGDGQYVQNTQARKNKNRYNGEGNLPNRNTSYGDTFELEKDGCWKKEVFIFAGNQKVTIGHRHFNNLGTEFSFSGGIENIDRLVSGPGTDPAYPQTGNVPVQNGNFFWPLSQEEFDLHKQLKDRYGSMEDLLVTCNEGRDQTDLPVDWCVPAIFGYARKDYDASGRQKAKTTDDALRVHLNDSMKNWTANVPVSFSFTITPGKDLNQAEQESQSTERSITITNYPDLEKLPGGQMNGWGTEDGANPTMDHSHVFITEDLFDNPDAFTSPVFNEGLMPGRVFGNPNGQFIQGSGTIHIFGDLRLDPAGTPPETGSSAYVRGQNGPGIAGCSLIPERPSIDFGWHMALTMLSSTNGNMGFPDNCDKGIHAVTPFNESIHLEIPFEDQAGGKNDFFLHMHEDSNAMFMDQGGEMMPGGGILSNIVIRIDFDD